MEFEGDKLWSARNSWLEPTESSPEGSEERPILDGAISLVLLIERVKKFFSLKRL